MSRIYSEAKSIGFQQVELGTMLAGNVNIEKPRDFKESISLQYTIPGPNPFSAFLLERTYEFCITYAPNPAFTTVPVFYSTDLIVPQLDAEVPLFYLAPTPDFNYPYTLTYLSFPPVFNGGQSRNFLTDKYPNLLLYACMVEAIPFLKSDERIPVFESLYNRALQAVNNDTKGRYTDRISKRDKN